MRPRSRQPFGTGSGRWVHNIHAGAKPDGANGPRDRSFLEPRPEQRSRQEIGPIYCGAIIGQFGHKTATWLYGG
jgi:hypothetical protein